MTANARHRVTLIPGDGIGPDVMSAARSVLDASGAEIEWDVRHAGAEEYERNGDPLPRSTLDSIAERGLALKGPTATPVGSGFRSVNLALRRALDLYAGIRPAKAYAGVPGVAAGTDLVVVRMNHEDLYAGIEYPADSAEAGEIRDMVGRSHDVELTPDSGISLKYLSRTQAERLARRAFEYARDSHRTRVTVVHKASVMRATDGVFRDAAIQVASNFPEIEFDGALVDTVCGDLARRRGGYDVLVLPTLYGDIVSDVAAGLVGGLGMAPGANLGAEHAMFEPVHGSAPRHAGHNRANPIAAILSGAMLLRHVGEETAAQRVEDAVAVTVAAGRHTTYDLRSADREPAATTSEAADAVIAALATGSK